MSTRAVAAIALVTESVRLIEPPATTLVALSETVDAKLGGGAGEVVGVTVGAADVVGLGAPEGGGVAVGPGALVGAVVPVGAGDGGTRTGADTAKVVAGWFAPYRGLPPAAEALRVTLYVPAAAPRGASPGMREGFASPPG